MILYISGPITGVDDFRERFEAAQNALTKAVGHTVINPAVEPLGLTPLDYMRISLARLEAADGIVLLPGWETSKGARIELLYAAYAGKPIYETSPDDGFLLHRMRLEHDHYEGIGPFDRDPKKAIVTRLWREDKW